MHAVHLSHIVARDRTGVIGREGDLPWRLGSDLAHFKAVTLGKPVLMGRKTWESLPRALPGRLNIVVSRAPNYAASGAEVFADLDTALASAREAAASVGEVMIIGGAAIYGQTLPLIDRLYLTDVDAEVAGDARYPMVDEAEWREVSATDYEPGPKDDHAFCTRILERRT